MSAQLAGVAVLAAAVMAMAIARLARRTLRLGHGGKKPR
jgi:hypothetical protein